MHHNHRTLVGAYVASTLCFFDAGIIVVFVVVVVDVVVAIVIILLLSKLFL